MTSAANKTYKARIERPVVDCHAMVVWFEAPNIMSAAKYISENFGQLGIDDSSVTSLIEVTKPIDPDKEEKNIIRTREGRRYA